MTDFKVGDRVKHKINHEWISVVTRLGVNGDFCLAPDVPGFEWMNACPKRYYSSAFYELVNKTPTPNKEEPLTTFKVGDKVRHKSKSELLGTAVGSRVVGDLDCVDVCYPDHDQGACTSHLPGELALMENTETVNKSPTNWIVGESFRMFTDEYNISIDCGNRDLLICVLNLGNNEDLRLRADEARLFAEKLLKYAKKVDILNGVLNAD